MLTCWVLFFPLGWGTLASCFSLIGTVGRLFSLSISSVLLNRSLTFYILTSFMASVSWVITWKPYFWPVYRESISFQCFDSSGIVPCWQRGERLCGVSGLQFGEQPKLCPLGDKTQGFLKTMGNVCIRCLERILSGVGSRKFGLAEQNWSKISYGSKLQGLGVCGVWPGSKSLLSPWGPRKRVSSPADGLLAPSKPLNISDLISCHVSQHLHLICSWNWSCWTI